MADNPESGNVKSKKRQSLKAVNRQAAAKVKATIHLSVDSSQRLTIHAAMLGLDRSELVEQLIQTHLRRFVVSDRGGQEELADDAAA
ncbi:ribbon-helix-helix protein, CopG family [Paludisphaera borealis]|uniref:ribbon-helix-helix protein, CopG family n=1 Tax=Paludisphaera borealis TaxID=1387353 RepID=UPI0009703A26|nr:ribbon-helix-helix protein, CopG family [Paludisphaera borealis]